ncbi:hypothetical protein CHS0354_014804 [Potamilus streckersoni]|uniref:Potassium channel tetramerisation-type BTB domain-containing protein n=1 Tax=Potamilus streckersoni TaxID=2493646 RepID=A0AAE0RVG1_9BIVA|nr:hypothetical protein CHS0354_014804 [Potamilus streckersoni]
METLDEKSFTGAPALATMSMEYMGRACAPGLTKYVATQAENTSSMVPKGACLRGVISELLEEGDLTYENSVVPIFFFDRDPAHFRNILNYLRNRALCELPTLPRELRFLYELKAEAAFHWMTGLVNIIERRTAQIRDDEL